MVGEAQQRAVRREALTASTFVAIVDALVDDVDVIEVLTVLTSRTVALLEIGAAGFLLADQDGQLQLVAASSEDVGLLELFQLQTDEGPCVDSFRSGSVVADADLGASGRWPRFAVESVRAGYPSVCAIPMRFRDRVLGCLNMFMSTRVELPPSDVSLAHALAGVASVAVVHGETARLAEVRQGQLQHALTSRIVIEQAKGMVAEHTRADMDQSFAALRAYARNHNLGLTDVAERVVAGTLAVQSITAMPPASGPR